MQGFKLLQRNPILPVTNKLVKIQVCSRAWWRTPLIPAPGRKKKCVCVCVGGGGCMDVFQVKVEGGVSGPEREEGGKEE
jgi:hypothetical protein